MKEMAEKIDQLEVKLNDMETKCAEVIKTKEAATKIVDIKKFKIRKASLRIKKKINLNQKMMSLNLELWQGKLQQIKSNIRKKKNQINVLNVRSAITSVKKMLI